MFEIESEYKHYYIKLFVKGSVPNGVGTLALEHQSW